MKKQRERERRKEESNKNFKNAYSFQNEITSSNYMLQKYRAFLKIIKFYFKMTKYTYAFQKFKKCNF